MHQHGDAHRVATAAAGRPSTPWRVAIVGAGRLGQYYCDAFTTFPDCELVAVVEPNAERGSAVCERFPVR